VSDTITALFALCPSAMEGSTGDGSDTIFIRCPFCGGGDNSPPVSVSRDKPVFFCHSCKVSGHITKLLTRVGVSSSAAQQWFPRGQGRSQPQESRVEDIIPAYANIKRSMQEGKLIRHVDPFKGLYTLDDAVLQRFRGHILQELLAEGFEQETLSHFGVGYDISRLKVTYPLRNVYGDLVGISGRAPIGDDGPKYKIYEQELVAWRAAPEGYSIESVKHAILWNWDQVKDDLVSGACGYLLIVEGFKAAMWLWQIGFKSVVACVGSAFTASHSEIIARVKPRDIITFFDNDPAGHKATDHALHEFLRRGVSARAAVYPEVSAQNGYQEGEPPKQPDDLETEEIETAIDNAEELKEAKRWLEL
jgi:DNA primase